MKVGAGAKNEVNPSCAYAHETSDRDTSPTKETRQNKRTPNVSPQMGTLHERNPMRTRDGRGKIRVCVAYAGGFTFILPHKRKRYYCNRFFNLGRLAQHDDMMIHRQTDGRPRSRVRCARATGMSSISSPTSRGGARETGAQHSSRL